MPKGSAKFNFAVDLIYIDHIERGLSLVQAAKLLPATYTRPSDGKICVVAKQRFHYIKRQFNSHRKNFINIKHQAETGIRIIEDSDLIRAKEEQAFLEDHLSYCSASNRDDKDEASLLSTTATVHSASKKQMAQKKPPTYSLSIPATKPAAIKIDDRMKNIGKFGYFSFCSGIIASNHVLTPISSPTLSFSSEFQIPEMEQTIACSAKKSHYT
jgi:hypothetical protein